MSSKSTLYDHKINKYKIKYSNLYKSFKGGKLIECDNYRDCIRKFLQEFSNRCNSLETCKVAAASLYSEYLDILKKIYPGKINIRLLKDGLNKIFNTDDPLLKKKPQHIKDLIKIILKIINPLNDENFIYTELAKLSVFDSPAYIELLKKEKVWKQTIKELTEITKERQVTVQPIVETKERQVIVQPIVETNERQVTVQPIVETKVVLVDPSVGTEEVRQISQIKRINRFTLEPSRTNNDTFKSEKRLHQYYYHLYKDNHRR